MDKVSSIMEVAIITNSPTIPKAATNNKSIRTGTVGMTEAIKAAGHNIRTMEAAAARTSAIRAHIIFRITRCLQVPLLDINSTTTTTTFPAVEDSTRIVRVKRAMAKKMNPHKISDLTIRGVRKR